MPQNSSIFSVADTLLDFWPVLFPGRDDERHDGLPRNGTSDPAKLPVYVHRDIHRGPLGVTVWQCSHPRSSLWEKEKKIKRENGNYEDLRRKLLILLPIKFSHTSREV